MTHERSGHYGSTPRCRRGLFATGVGLAGAVLAGLLGMPTPTAAQSFADLQVSEEPLVLSAQGSFFVGGERVERTADELGGFGPGGHVTVGQMYVRYMVPHGARGVPIVMLHGMALTGKTWETTPDGRMGWDEYVVRQGHPVYVPDQVSRGRSGFDPAVLNRVRVGASPPDAQPPAARFSDEVVWPNFRFGVDEGAPFPDTRFPVGATGELSKQGVPDLNAVLPTPNPTYRALSELAAQLEGAVLLSHSQSGHFPLEAALIDDAGIRGAVLVEPGYCPAYSDGQIAALVDLPVLVVYGDRLGDTPTGIPGFSWQTAFEGCDALVRRLTAAGGNARMLRLPDLGVRGNSHLPMMDDNHLEVADLLLDWVDAHVAAPDAPARD